MYQVNFNVNNALNTPSIAADTFANRPAVAATGAVYIATDTGSMYRFNGSTWTSIGGGGISGSGTVNKIPVWTSASALGDSDLVYTVPGAYPNKQIISGCSFESQYADPTINGNAAGYIVRRTANNTIVATLLGLDTTVTAAKPIFNTYASDDYYFKIFGTANNYHAWFKNGNVVINGYTDAGYKFDIQGTFRSTGIATIYDNTFAFTPVTIKGGSTDGSIYIGGASMAGNNSVRNVIINPINSYSALTGSSNTIIGRSASSSLTSGTNNVYIGTGGTGISTGSFNTIIGNSTATYASTLQGSLVINTAGENTTQGTNFDYPSGSYWTFIGGYSSGNANKEFYFGASPFINQAFGLATSSVNFYAPSGIGTDIYGGNFTLNAGRGTGTGTPGDLIFSTSTTGSTGTTLQTLTSRWFVKGNSGILSNQSSVNASALIDLYSTTQGLGIMAMTATQKTSIASPRAGIMVYDTTNLKLCFYDGTAWRTVTSV